MGDTTPYFWAKTTPDGQPGCSVREHCIATAEVARLLLELLPQHLRDQLPEGLLSIVALHDVGKISPGFQTKCAQWKGPAGDTDEKTFRQWKRKEQAHAATSEWVIGEYIDREHPDNDLWFQWAECAGAHHGTYNNTINTYPFNKYRREFSLRIG